MRLVYLSPSRGISLDQSGGAGTHIRGTIKGFEDNNIVVLPLIAGDMFKTDFKVLHSKSYNKTENKNTQFLIRSFLKKLLPDKLRLLLREIRTIKEDIEYINKAKIKIAEFKPDAIYERSGYLSNAGIKLAKHFNLPLFFETDGCMVEIIQDDYGVFSKNWGNKIEENKMRKADFIVVMNKLAIKFVSNKFNVPEEKFLVKTLGIENNDILLDQKKIDALRDNYNLKENFVIGFVGSISTYHGVGLLIDAAKIINDQGFANIKILIIGWSKEGELIKSNADSLGLNNVIFTGKIDKSEVPYYYALMNVGVIPNAEESIYPIKVLEYGIFKLCPLVPDLEVFKEIIQEGKNGYSFTPKNAEALANKILYMSKNWEDVKNCSDIWHENVKEKFKWEYTVKSIVKKLRGFQKKEVD